MTWVIGYCVLTLFVAVFWWALCRINEGESDDL